ncbi:hypothetical protein ABZ820_05090 [Streptomyces diacarni]|uniref:hypothetical protein n=1 Tax=Streptomyces diacarni TaxID=2800381 RepID=UPI0033F54619
MAMYARRFYDELGLPFPDSVVVGTTYYANPIPGGPLRLRIDFCRTIRVDEYGGLRLATLHQVSGELDTAILRFEDHHTFDHRDARHGRTPQHSGYGTFTESRDRPDSVPWEGAYTEGLRDAIEQYTAIWFPGTSETSAPGRAAGRAARPAPPQSSVRRGGRAH